MSAFAYALMITATFCESSGRSLTSIATRAMYLKSSSSNISAFAKALVMSAMFCASNTSAGRLCMVREM